MMDLCYRIVSLGAKGSVDTVQVNPMTHPSQLLYSACSIPSNLPSSLTFAPQASDRQRSRSDLDQWYEYRDGNEVLL